MSAISKELVEELELEKFASKAMSSASGEVMAGVYICWIEFADGTEFCVPVVDASNLKTDILIGMDVISQGDFRLYHERLDNLVLEFDKRD